MKMYAEEIVPIRDVRENINLMSGNELKECKKVELELRTNASAKKVLLDDIWDNICKELNSEALKNSTYNRSCEERNIPDGMCEYRVKIFDRKGSC